MIVGMGTIALALLALATAGALYRIVRGPSVPDRVLAADLLTSAIMGVLLVTGAVEGVRDRMDAVMTLGLVSFFATVLFARYLLGERPVD